MVEEKKNKHIFIVNEKKKNMTVIMANQASSTEMKKKIYYSIHSQWTIADHTEKLKMKRTAKQKKHKHKQLLKRKPKLELKYFLMFVIFNVNCWSFVDFDTIQESFEENFFLYVLWKTKSWK